QALRQVVARRAEVAGIAVCWPPAVYCTDNAAMIAAAGTFSSIAGRRDGMELNAYASSGIE
ncbi:MAG TPA: tRNA (adenosine(37)-N6)-threonylcarbamoyltransferase complex transferase subunit TsaD, partial [Clostridia bacterium]